MTETRGIFFLLPLLLLVGPLAPYMRTVVSNSVPHAEQAQMFAAFSALEGISALAGPMYSAAYTLLVQNNCAWVIFEIMAGAALIALLIATYVRCTPHLNKHLPEVPEDGAELEPEDLSPDRLHGAESGKEGDEEENPLHEGLLEPTGRNSRVSADGTRLVPVDNTTLLYRHLAHNSVASEAEAASVDHTGATSNITARLLAEQFSYESDE
jgi:hypothetical protein